MARRLVQRVASQEEINEGSFDSVMSLQTYLGEDTFPDIPEVQENHGEAQERVSIMSYLLTDIVLDVPSSVNLECLSSRLFKTITWHYMDFRSFSNICKYLGDYDGHIQTRMFRQQSPRSSCVFRQQLWQSSPKHINTV